MSETTTAPPANTCNGLTFIPVPEFDELDAAFGAIGKDYFRYPDLPDVPREYEEKAQSLFFKGGEVPEFKTDVDRKKAVIALRAWLCSFAPKHEEKIATVAYALWVWSAT